MIRRLLPLAFLALAAASPVDVRNNHPFPVRMPYTLPDGQTLFLDLPANAHQSITPDTPPSSSPFSLQQDPAGVSLLYNHQNLGHLSWSLVLHPVTPDYITADKDAHSIGRPADFQPQPLNLSFTDTPGPLFSTHTAQTTLAGLHIAVTLRAYPAGFLDITTTVTNQSAPQKNVYAALLTQWNQPPSTTRTTDYNSTISPLKDSTPWRAPGDRHQFVLRGLNWINSSLPAGPGVLWLNAFAPSFTIHHPPKGKTPAQWVGANSAQLDQEAYLDGNTLTHVTELAHGNVKSYRSRLDDYTLPDPSQPLTFTHRLIFTGKPLTNEDATHAFIAYTTFNPLSPSPGTPGEGRGEGSAQQTLNLGVPSVTFGTAYFPYSTLGENFIHLKLPGMSQDSYWPLAADVVKNYKLFADDIQRDLRIAKSMGFQSIRLHHLEMLWTDEKSPVQITDAQRTAFLDFFFSELKHVGLTALLDVKLPPDQIADLIKRYRPQLDGVEIDNEILIFGIQDKDIPYWKQCYEAVKKAAPDLPVHWTAHTNTAAFNRLSAEGVSFDRIGQHAYMDGETAVPLSRDFALQVASYASSVNKPPVITEWNWRFLTRMTEDARAKIFPPIFENVLQARAIPEIYQFQFNDSLAMSPLSLKGIRHYELLNLSRRPKAEAREFDRLVRTYSDPASPFRALDMPHYQSISLPANFPNRDNPVILVGFTNTTNRDLKMTVSAEGPADLQPRLTSGDNPKSFTLKPGSSYTAQLTVTFPKDALPGFYHAFVRFETTDGLIAYATVEFRRPGQPTFDTSPHLDIFSSEDAFTLDLTQPTAIIYGDDCPPLELEAAWTIYQTLESATGRPVQIFSSSTLPKTGLTNLIYLGTPKSLPSSIPPSAIRHPKSSITRLPNSNTLLITGPTSQDAALAAMDYTLRYWKSAKDAASRRIPLAHHEIPKGADAAQLP